MRAPVAVHSMRPEAGEGATRRRKAEPRLDLASAKTTKTKTTKTTKTKTTRKEEDWEEEEADRGSERAELSAREESEGANLSVPNEDDDDDESDDDEAQSEAPATRAPRRVERAARRANAASSKASSRSGARAAAESEELLAAEAEGAAEAVEDIDGNMVIYLSSGRSGAG